ncbi:unnamed protein product [Strongylus vulgaris]|uniref:Uncharacterized protein n=1 Tax=Strongylus vulgaris TaxID=40348 RepID=A0A3P7IFK2_STRVU|nr:unnamed protein product [Strongylus vulgaris]
MRAINFFLVAGVVFADYQSQNSGYENAEIAQPTPEAPLSADGGDQQAYNSDVGSDGGLPLVPSQPPASGPTLLSPVPLVETASDSNGGSVAPEIGSDAGIGYRNRRRFRLRHALRSRRL